uniref:Uncharacterized protein n=1 Tax=Anguilla anguilla TaxID=7936 RepID=A0A0E9PXY3_ANGAN
MDRNQETTSTQAIPCLCLCTNKSNDQIAVLVPVLSSYTSSLQSRDHVISL